jgi:hypothetical protein
VNAVSIDRQTDRQKKKTTTTTTTTTTTSMYSQGERWKVTGEERRKHGLQRKSVRE